MTPEDRARLRALADKANLPWRVGDEPEWVSVADNNINPVVCQYGVEPGGFVDPDDATYAVLAANAVPALLDTLDELEAEVAARRDWDLIEAASIRESLADRAARDAGTLSQNDYFHRDLARLDRLAAHRRALARAAKGDNA